MKKIIALAIVAIFALSVFIPATSGSTLKITLYPDKNLSNVNLISESELIFKYPNGSFASRMLNGTSQSISFSETYNNPSDHAIAFMEGFLKSRYHNITVINMTVEFNLNEKANYTTLVIWKNVTMDLWLSGIFNKTKSETRANLSWRAFEVRGSFMINNHDINDFGSYLGPISMLSGVTDQLNNKSTINFTMLGKSLKDWNRVYDPSSNTTTFYYNSSMNVLFNMTLSMGGSSGTQNYSLEILYDPSSSITVPGYATATNNSIVIQPTAPSSINDTLIAVIAVVVVIIVVGGVAIVVKRKK